MSGFDGAHDSSVFLEGTWGQVKTLPMVKPQPCSHAAMHGFTAGTKH